MEINWNLFAGDCYARVLDNYLEFKKESNIQIIFETRNQQIDNWSKNNLYLIKVIYKKISN